MFWSLICNENFSVFPFFLFNRVRNSVLSLIWLEVSGQYRQIYVWIVKSLDENLAFRPVGHCQENLSPRYLPYVKGIYRWIPLIKGQLRGKCFMPWRHHVKQGCLKSAWCFMKSWSLKKKKVNWALVTPIPTL